MGSFKSCRRNLNLISNLKLKFFYLNVFKNFILKSFRVGMSDTNNHFLTVPSKYNFT